jgi:plasmid stabilization system protein ParE
MKVYLSKQAEYKLDLLLTYLLDIWSEKEKDEFIKILKSKFKQISTFPESCPKSNKRNGLFKCVLTKQITFFYRIHLEKEIEIITFFDTRQNPDKLKTEL